MQLRKYYKALTLLLLLLIAQHGALVHDLSHLARVVSIAGHSVDATVDGGSNCELCLSYAQLGNAANTSPPIVQVLPAKHELNARPPGAACESQAPTPRSRGPPALS